MARIPMSEPSLGEEELKNVIEAIKTNWISSNGHFIADFEKGFSQYIGRKNGIAVNNGTSALHLPLAALGIGKGDKEQGCSCENNEHRCISCFRLHFRSLSRSLIPLKKGKS